MRVAGLLLTEAERSRFAEWLEHEAHSTEGIVTQMESIRTPEVLIAKLKAEAVASRLIAAKLRATHDGYFSPSLT